MGVKEKLEKTITAFFRANFEEIREKMAQLQANYQLFASIELGNKYLLVCEEIQGDPRFQYMTDFLATVANATAELSAKVSELDAQIDNNGLEAPKKGARDTSQLIEQFQPLYSRFYAQVDQIQAEIYSAFAIKPTNEFEHYLNQSKLLLKSKIKRDFAPEQEKLIRQFRRQMTPEQRAEVQKPLTLRQELKLFDDYRLAIEYHLVDLEDKGWFNTVRLYCDKWAKYLQKMAVFHAKHFREALTAKIEKEAQKIEKWRLKVENKYDKKMQLDTAQMAMLNQTIKDMILRYREDRKKLKQYEEDKRILNKIAQLT